jgi:hypothetical protein
MKREVVQSDVVDFHEITHKITDQDKTTGDLFFILHRRTESSKTKVELSGRNIISKTFVFLKYKTKTILCHTHDPLCLLLKMVSVSVFVSRGSSSTGHCEHHVPSCSFRW